MSISHTPGPWHVEDGALTKGNEQPTGWFICHPKTECDATALAWVEREADALMFAAAPDAIRALERALEYWAHRQQRYRNRAPVWVVAARAAISKATSRQPEGER